VGEGKFSRFAQETQWIGKKSVKNLEIGHETPAEGVPKQELGNEGEENVPLIDMTRG
jgi:hypothetical protein